MLAVKHKQLSETLGCDVYEANVGDGRVVAFWLDMSGLNARQIVGVVDHKDEHISYQDIMAKAEHQLTLL